MSDFKNIKSAESLSPLQTKKNEGFSEDCEQSSRDLRRGLLFINGIPPKNLPDTEGYDVIACTDGAFHYLKEKNFALEKLDFVSGDFDSHTAGDEILHCIQNDKFEVIFTPDQNFTDFQKAIDILKNKGIKKIDVYGGSGGEQDHFLGNLHVAFLFKNELEITFYDEFSSYFFIPKLFEINHIEGKMISLLPFPKVENLTTDGLNWELHHAELCLTKRIGTRNFATKSTVKISFESGDLLVFIGK